MVANNMRLNRVLQGDCLDVLRGMAANSVDSDPPAGISFMGKDWDKDKGGKAQWVEWMTEVATECLRVIKPGGHALVWSIPRTSHWTGDAWENAGWQPRDKIYHCFGSGFPKSHNVSKAIDKAAGVERKVVGVSSVTGNRNSETWRDGSGLQGNVNYITAPPTDAARQWEGWGTALKPAIEEWWLFRKPLQGTLAQNVQEWGTGALNIDGCRVGDTVETWPKSRSYGGYAPGQIGKGKTMATGDAPAGRWPANLIHSGEPSVVACFPETVSGNLQPHHRRGEQVNTYGKSNGAPPSQNFGGDSGSAARFFKTCPDDDPEDAETRRLIYQGKATKRDRDEGLEGFEFIGIEMDAEYVAIANARIAAAAARSEKATLEQRVAWLETQVQAQGAKLRKIEASQQLSLWG